MSGLYQVTKSGNVANPDMIKAVDHLLEMEKKLGHWEMINLIVKMWANKNPEMAKSYLNRTENEMARGVMKNKYAANKDMGMRKILDVPVDLWDLLNFFYADNFKEKKFVLEFAKRYPMFKVPEKL